MECYSPAPPNSTGPARLARRAGLLAGILLAMAMGTAAHEVTFHLVPEETWDGAAPGPRDFLPEGRVLLFRHGAYRPAVTLEANVPGAVPPGNWHWVAEAPGHVSVLDGLLRLPEGAERARKRVVWPVAPACEIDFGEAAEWQGVTRVDLVSLDRQAVYPVVPRERRRAALPAGRFLAYTLGARGVMAVSRPASCRKGETHPLERPAPPLATRQDLILSARLPAALAASARRGLGALLLPLGAGGTPMPEEAGLLPDATIWAGDRATFFFLGIEAARPLRLILRHPDLLTASRDLPPLGGGVREVEVALAPRLALEVTVDYRPLRPHRRKELVLLRCGDQPGGHLLGLDPASCQQVGEARPLVPGASAYRFTGLDAGWYALEAWIDEERVPGAGGWYAPHLGADSPPLTRGPVLRLPELHVYGHLLREGDPVPGDVRLEPTLPGTAAPRRFPTDADLLYHVYYFGQPPTPYSRAALPEELRKAPAEELRGLFHTYRLRACDAEGFCRPFHHRSTLSGEGRWDLDLGAERELAVEVVDADSGEPVEGARVLAGVPGARHPTEHFHRGAVLPGEAGTLEAPFSHSDEKGEARLRDLPAGPQRLAVSAPGYEPYRRAFTMPPAGRLRLRAQLSREAREEGGGPVLRFAGGGPVQRAYLLLLRADGTPDYGCSASTSRAGEVDLPPRCLDGGSHPRAVVLHPRAALQTLPIRTLAESGEVEIRPAPSLPLRLRLVDADGQPLAHAPVVLGFPSFQLGPDPFLIARTFTGWHFPFRTNAGGEILLPWIDSRPPLPRLALDPRGPWQALAPAPAGEILEVVLPGVAYDP